MIVSSVKKRGAIVVNMKSAHVLNSLSLEGEGWGEGRKT